MDDPDTFREIASGHAGSIWTGNFLLLCSANFTLLLSVQMLLPTLPLYLLTIGGGQSDVGFVMASYTISAMFMRAVSGWLSDRYGRKKIMVTGLAMALAVTILYWTVGSVSSAAAVRALHGISFGLAGTAMGAIVADSVPVARMAEGLGYYGLTATLSMGIAPMLGIWLAGRFNYSVLFVVVTSVALVSLLFGLPAKSSTRVHVRVPRTSVTRTLSNMVDKSALLPSLIMFFLCLVNGSILYFIALYGAELSIGNVGLFFAVNSLFMVISRPISGRWADRGGSTTVILIGFLAVFSGMTTIALSHVMAGFLLAGALVGFGFGFSMPTLQALAVRNAPADRRGAATGTYFAAFDLGFGVGAVLWGFVAQKFGYRTMYFTTLIPLTLAAVIYFRLRARMAPQESDIDV